MTILCRLRAIIARLVKRPRTTAGDTRLLSYYYSITMML
jgi:hypothetical protein